MRFVCICKECGGEFSSPFKDDTLCRRCNHEIKGPFEIRDDRGDDDAD